MKEATDQLVPRPTLAAIPRPDLWQRYAALPTFSNAPREKVGHKCIWRHPSMTRVKKYQALSVGCIEPRCKLGVATEFSGFKCRINTIPKVLADVTAFICESRERSPHPARSIRIICARSTSRSSAAIPSSARRTAASFVSCVMRITVLASGSAAPGSAGRWTIDSSEMAFCAILVAMEAKTPVRSCTVRRMK